MCAVETKSLESSPGIISALDLPLGHLTSCQICASQDLELILDLGHQAPCDSLLKKAQLFDFEKTYPLQFLRCRRCSLAQINYVVAPEVLFYPEYPYRSGITVTLTQNLQSMAVRLCKDLPLAKDSLVIDIGSNDGTLLQAFKSQGMRVLGIEPTNIANIAINNGIPTVQDFFSAALAEQLCRQHEQASVITAANMFAHVARLGDLIRGVNTLLVEGGLFLTESHYLLDLLQTVQYDSIYHEHLKYYSLRSLMVLFGLYDFTVTDAERIPNYGGSVRVYARKGKGHPVSRRMNDLLEEEHSILDRPDTYAHFRERVVQSKIDLQSLLLDIRKRGKRIVGVGCPGRASTLINYCNVDSDLLPSIAEQSNSLKLGLFLPGRHIPIVDEKSAFERKPDYALMLSWHYATPIIKKLRQKGFDFKVVIPLPEVRLLENE